MSWPWVSRADYERLDDYHKEAAAIYEREIAFLRQNIANQATWYKELLDQFTNLANPPTSPHLPTRNVEKSEPSIIAKTIREESGGDIRLAHYFRKRVTQLRRENPKMTDEEIAEQIATWESTDSEMTG